MSLSFNTKCLGCDVILHSFEEIEVHNKKFHNPEPWYGFNLGRPKPAAGKEKSESLCDVCGQVTTFLYWRREPRIPENLGYLHPQCVSELRKHGGAKNYPIHDWSADQKGRN